jgi:putative hydrolase of the HAD superfamily
LGRITTLFFDIGGVLLTNGWDTPAREKAAAKFGLDWDEFERRHHAAVDAFEKGRISIDEYVKQVAFDKPRDFAPAQFRDFIYSQSQEFPEARAFVDRLGHTPGFLVAAINNEGREVNAYRIGTFHLDRTFSLFFSSCYVGLRKPDPAIFRLALDVTQRKAVESVFIDDRLENVEGARSVGLETIQYRNVSQVEADLRALGVNPQSETKAEAARES